MWDSQWTSSEQDHSRGTKYGDWLGGFLVALSTKGTDWNVYQTTYHIGCWITILEAYKPAWPMLKEVEYNYWLGLCNCHQLQEMISDISKLLDIAIHEGSAKCKHAGIHMMWMSISWEAYETDTRSYMIDHCGSLQWHKLKLPKRQQSSLKGWACTVIHEELGEVKC